MYSISITLTECQVIEVDNCGFYLFLNVLMFLGNRRVLFDLKKNGIDGLADGMAIDAQNNIWVAVHGGGKVSKIQRDCKFVNSFLIYWQ